MERFYSFFNDIKEERFDGLVITGAPVEQLEFEEVMYWDELKEIMEWSKSNVFSTLHICWGAQAGLNYHYGIPKYKLEKKYDAKIVILNVTDIDISSSMIRERLANGKRVDFFLPEEVKKYISENKLYRRE